ncbi:MAG: QueT transporter family protein [Clostridia bacterium]|nr:QueT transporter family protein [Clostridia bacterium]MBR0444761.1 QueT transporter family protein [Clostridia bacterium]
MSTKYLAKAGIIGALYAVLTIVLAPISYGMFQCRISEALCVLPCLTSAAVPGLFLGCLAANLITGAPVYDVVFGSLATLLGAWGTLMLSRRNASKYLLPLPTVVCNAVIVGLVLRYAYGVDAPLPLIMLLVGAGEAVACYLLGLPLLRALRDQRFDFMKD